MKRKRENNEFSDSDESLLLEAVLNYEKQQTSNEFSDIDEELLIAAVDDFEAKKLTCELCSKRFKSVKAISKHLCSHSKRFNCDQCTRSFTRKYNLIRHKESNHGKRKKHSAARSSIATFSCAHCDMEYQQYSELFEHVRINHPLNQRGGRVSMKEKKLSSPKQTPKNIVNDNYYHNDVDVEELPVQNEIANEAALEDNVNNIYIIPRNDERYDLLTFFANIRAQVRSQLLRRLRTQGAIKWNLCVQVEMERMDNGEQATTWPFFRSRTYMISNIDDFDEHSLNEAFQLMSASMEKFMKEGSSWYVKRVLVLEIHTIRYRPISGSTFISLPKTLRYKSRMMLNIRNNFDFKCFAWSVLAQIHQTVAFPDQVSSYEEFEHELNMSGIEYPVSLKDINKFERQNLSLSVNVFAMDNNDIVPVRITSNAGRQHHANLLIICNGETFHYCLIRDLNGFLARTSKRKRQLHFCPYCLHGFTRGDLLLKHQPYCSINGPQRIILPEENKDDTLQYSDYSKELEVPFVIYADCETYNTEIQSCQEVPNGSGTTRIKELNVCGMAYKVVSINPKFTKETVVYRGEDAGKKLLEKLLEEMREIEKIINAIKPMELDEMDLETIKTQTSCCLCRKELLSDKVRHHNHITGKFIGLAHNECNLKCRQKKFIPVLFHNLKNFDSHIMCQHLGKFPQYKLNCIPQNSERYISFSIGKLRFIDTLQFLNSSLETLVSNLAQDGVESFPHLLSEFARRQDAELLLRKGVYPYDYVTDEAVFEETRLPPIECFYSEIKKETISSEDYAHAQEVFKHFDMRNIGMYHDLYVKVDVLLLCDVFEAFRKTSLSQYKLDPCHFYTSPGLAWSASLKMTGVKLQLLTDIEQVLFIERGLRGGVSQISNRYKKANNPSLEDFDDSRPISYLHYLDMNNLYGYAMTEKLPIDSFEFMDEEDVKKFDVRKVSDKDDIGYILEVDLHYPNELHDSHNDYPLAPEKMSIDNKNLSSYAKRLWNSLHGQNEDEEVNGRANQEKLICHLGPRTNYIVHIRNLQLYLELGMKMTTIHRILRFRQKAWLKSYIQFNTEQRKRATTNFQKNFYKLMNVAVFGKTMENVRKHLNLELVHTPKRLQKLAAKPTYKTTKIFTEDLVAVEQNKCKVKMYKPIYCGMTILEISKLAMYTFYYKYLKPKYEDSLQLQFTDTDSLLYYCETEDIYKDMLENIELFDTSDYPCEHFLYSDRNKKVVGKMKDETKGIPISEFVGLRSKMYSFMCDNCEYKRAKGIAKVTIDKDINFQMYKDTLFNESQKHVTMTSIQSHSHRLFCENVKKVGLSAFCDKRYLTNAIESYAYFHYKTEQM